ncbi:hypothetical protein ACTXT7_003231 [Hymenolepis weldensis]
MNYRKISQQIYEKNNTTLSGSSGFPGDNPDNQDKPESRRNSEKDSKNSNEHEMNARQSKGAMEIGPESSKSKNLSGNDTNSEKLTEILNSILTVDPATSSVKHGKIVTIFEKLKAVIDQIWQIPDEGLEKSVGEATSSSHESRLIVSHVAGKTENLNENELSASGSMRQDVLMSLFHGGSAMKADCSLAALAIGNNSKPVKAINVSGKGTNFEQPKASLNANISADPLTSRVRNATDYDIFKRPYLAKVKVGSRVVGKTGVNNNLINIIFKETVSKDSNKIEVRSLRTPELPVRSMEINPSRTSGTNSGPERTIASDSRKSNFSQRLDQILGPQVNSHASQISSNLFQDNPNNASLKTPVNPIPPSLNQYLFEPTLPSNSFANATTTSEQNANTAPSLTSSSHTLKKLPDNRCQDPNGATISNPAEVTTANQGPSTSKRNRRKQSRRLTQYQCNICRESFRKAKDLDTHTKTLHGKYKCLACGDRLTEFSNLKRHATSHMDILPYRCRLCFKAYRRQDHLKRHMDCNHPGYNPDRDMEVVVDTAEFLKYTVTPQNAVNAHTDPTDIMNASNNLDFMAQDLNPQSSNPNSAATPVISEKNPRNACAEHSVPGTSGANQSSMAKHLNLQANE